MVAQWFQKAGFICCIHQDNFMFQSLFFKIYARPEGELNSEDTLDHVATISIEAPMVIMK